MINKQSLSKLTDKICSIAEKYEIEDFKRMGNELNSLCESFDIKVMFVGHFNAGKSALINALINRSNFLKEEQVPQTAVAAELHFGEKERILGYLRGGGAVELDKNTVLNSADYHHIEYTVNSESLSELCDFTVVDTPGFDSGIENHNKALAEYLMYGSVFVVIVDAEKGGIDQYTLNFIREISSYSRQLVVLLNKCDKHTEDTVEQIKEAAVSTLDLYGYDSKVYCVSKYDDDIEKKLIEIISGFDAQRIFDEKIGKQIYTTAVSMKNTLKITERRLYLDTDKFDREINNFETAMDYISDCFKVQKSEAESKHSNLTDEIISKIRDALTAKADSAVQAALNGGEKALQAVVLETLRPILISSLKEAADDQLDDIAERLDFGFLFDEETSDEIFEVFDGLVSNVKDNIENGTFSKISDALNNAKNKEGDSTFINIYRNVAGALAIVTDFIAPWLEIIIVLLPDILRLAFGFFGETKEEKLKKQYITGIIPTITSELYEPVSKAVNESCTTLTENIEKSVSEKIDAIEASLKEVKNNKKTERERFDTYKNNIRSDIETLEKVAEQTRRYSYGN